MQTPSLFDAPTQSEAAGGQDIPPRPRRVPAPAPRPAGPVLLAVDGNSLAHRAFHGYDTPERRGGRYGFLALFAALADRVGPNALVVGFDCPRTCARRERYAAYKAGRPAKDPGLVALLAELPDLLTDVGVHVVVASGWEADDVVGSAASQAEAHGWRCVVATSDRDAFSLVSAATTVLRLRTGMDAARDYTVARLRREVGVAPGQYVEFAALRGDASDNLPGIAGIGPSRAAALLDAYPTVDAAAADPLGCRSVLGRVQGQALLDDLTDPGTSVFRRNVELMTLRRDLPVPLDACRRKASPDRVAARLTARGLGAVAARMAVAVAALPARLPLPGDADVPRDADTPMD